MNIKIRPEEEKDFKIVENLTREAFRDLYKPGCDEHFILHNMREVLTFVRELDFVACDEDKVVGNIVYTKAKIINNEQKEFEVLCMGPVGVLPSYQKKGIGSLLINHTIQNAKELGYKAIILFGNPDFYHRFGFVNAEKYQIQTSDGSNFDPFMVLELYDGALNGISGRFNEDKVFEVNKEELKTFEKKFPYKEKHITDTQLKT